MGKSENSGTQSSEELNEFVVKQLGGGKSRREVVLELTEQGMTDSEAHQTVERVYFAMKKTAEEEEFSSGALVPGILGGVLAAAIGGVAWAGIGIATERELGLLAWAIGLICGMGVLLFAGRKKGFPLQIVAVVTSILGIVIGKYGLFYYYFQQSLLEEENGAELVAEYGLVSANMIQVFGENLSQMMAGYDLIWIGLAVVTAWGIPKPSSLQT